ncbi:hypothetical protein [Lacinutrix sp. Bg11-31]|uniref:hypothetical protein n=1 Tax=Lacinutrix sp. Bg11-31 TaxID=2057808 RepID=UPI000C306814|nr:hypothetical protein [Lacinutrix sp. Bg11-31]AUC81023.1 hypothetical protein CW733_02280 [Lacinutrix sp. Bg11-31]
MKNYTNYIVLCFCLLISNSLYPQIKKTAKLSAKNQAKARLLLPSAQIIKLAPRKMMPYRKDKIWVLGTNTSKGHWSKPLTNEINTFYKNKQYYTYPIKLYSSNWSYNKAHLNSSFTTSIGIIKKKGYKIPKKVFNINTIVPDWDWIRKKKIRTIHLAGTPSKKNVYFLKKIKKNQLISFKTAHDHIIVTDTLYAPISIISTEREKRNYIKIIANCIVYESPIKPASVHINSKTDYVFSTKKIIFKSKYEDLEKTALTPAPPFVIGDTNIKIHKDPYLEDESKLMNRLFIEIMMQIVRDLNSDIDEWEKDKLLTEFQNYKKNKINHDILYKDKDYDNDFRNVCSQIENIKIRKNRKLKDLDLFVEGNFGDLPEVPFKYYTIPTKATLLPVKNITTGIQDKLGDIYFKAGGDSKLSLTIQTKLGYDATKLIKANLELNAKGVILESNTPKTVIKFEEQPLKSSGKTIGKITPISNQILRFEIDLQEENLDLIKLFLQTNNTFNLDYKVFQGQKEGSQKISLKIPENILKQLDFTDLQKEFNTIESNTSTIIDAIKITSNLSPVLESTGEGTLEYIEISLAFLFQDKTVFRGPKRFSSHSVNGSEEEIYFMKYSEDYTIKITGTAYYEFGQRDIVNNNSFTNTKYITLQESMFKKND